MQIHWHNLLLLGALSATIHWIIARSHVAQPLWSRARGWLASLLACPACSGFWIGLYLAFAGFRAVQTGSTWVEYVCNGLLGCYLTPLFEMPFLYALHKTAIQEVEIPVSD